MGRSADELRTEEAAASGAGYSVRGRIWIEGDGGTFIGYGRVVLLERIKEHGSITEAARSMGMSYRNAWELVESMNSQAQEPLVTTSTGGKGGGGAVVTRSGEDAIRYFWQLHKSFSKFLDKELQKLPFKKEKK
ncbi:MAG: LysR family transcriptional regulator [Nitrospirae bacterium]|nr:LysR family transcriptional regulator [Nitrospirota bacterium]